MKFAHKRSYYTSCRGPLWALRNLREPPLTALINNSAADRSEYPQLIVSRGPTFGQLKLSCKHLDTILLEIVKRQLANWFWKCEWKFESRKYWESFLNMRWFLRLWFCAAAARNINLITPWGKCVVRSRKLPEKQTASKHTFMNYMMVPQFKKIFWLFFLFGSKSQDYFLLFQWSWWSCCGGSDYV